MKILTVAPIQAPKPILKSAPIRVPKPVAKENNFLERHWNNIVWGVMAIVDTVSSFIFGVLNFLAARASTVLGIRKVQDSQEEKKPDRMNDDSEDDPLYNKDEYYVEETENCSEDETSYSEEEAENSEEETNNQSSLATIWPKAKWSPTVFQQKAAASVRNTNANTNTNTNGNRL